MNRVFLEIPAFLALMMLALQGCDSGAKPSNQSTVTTVVDPSKANEPADESFAPEEYARLGIPDPDHVWTAVDMAAAEKVLAAIAQKNARNLPRYKSERSGAVFARLTSPRNLDAFKDRSLPLAVRMSQARDYGNAFKETNKLYVYAFRRKNARDTEVVEMTGAMLRMVAVTLGLVDEFRPTLKADDPNYAVRIAGQEQMRTAMAGIVLRYTNTLTERENYRRGERVKLLTYMQETFPLIVPALSSEAGAEAMNQLDKMQEDASLQDLQPALGELRSKVKAALEKGG